MFNEQIKEIDDLELVQCPGCMGSRMLQKDCPACHGDGKIVKKVTKFYVCRDVRKERQR